MRILSVGNFYGPSWDGSLPDEEHIAQSLEELGHEVGRCQREHIEFTDGGQWDFTLIAQYDHYNDDLTKSLPRPLIYWSFDYQADGQEWHERLVKQSDLYLSKRLADAKYPNWRYLPQDFSPEFLDKYPEPVEKDIDVLFTGSYLPWAYERNAILKAVDDKFNLHIYGVTPNEWKAGGFKNVYGPAMDDALPALIARAKINLSIDHTHEAGYWSDRNAQTMACGGFVLFRYVPMSEIVFRSHVAYFFNQEHCLDQIAWWLEHDEDREVIAAEGYEYAQSELMVRERVADMLNIVRSVL